MARDASTQNDDKLLTYTLARLHFTQVAKGELSCCVESSSDISEGKTFTMRM